MVEVSGIWPALIECQSGRAVQRSKVAYPPFTVCITSANQSPLSGSHSAPVGRQPPRPAAQSDATKALGVVGDRLGRRVTWLYVATEKVKAGGGWTVQPFPLLRPESVKSVPEKSPQPVRRQPVFTGAMRAAEAT